MGEHALMALEAGTVRDLASPAALPDRSGGVLTSGGSMASLPALACARTWFLTGRDAASASPPTTTPPSRGSPAPPWNSPAPAPAPRSCPH
ncbi:hypothetical protein OTB20_33070 [Streptomyces sp. H27-H1]|uniref:hypothetical protein n=1 Tax=Streptomyces sp. H27-H1 TaxID=2996461 RepID=UPI00226E11D1|nr:hypothetical protein [Streptomyces sp. H27-H1]MCY0930941.1 hypothetical protein [Streptomyces sp. H27-H1]